MAVCIVSGCERSGTMHGYLAGIKLVYCRRHEYIFNSLKNLRQIAACLEEYNGK